jgi:hypothetical protein
MRLVDGDNHLISVRDGLLICQVWVRPDLSAEDGARNAQEMVDYLMTQALRRGTHYRGLIFDVRRGPAKFGPKTRAVLEGLLAAAAAIDMPVAMLAGPDPVQERQFAELCAACKGQTRVFGSEAEAVHWFSTPRD